MTGQDRYWIAGYQGALTELLEMGMGAVSARGVLHAAGKGETVDIGEGQHVRKVPDQPGRYAISRMGA